MSETQASDPEIADEVLAGTKSLGEATREIRERELGVNRVSQPMKRVVQDILKDVREEKTAKRIVKTAMTLSNDELAQLAARYENGNHYDRSYVGTRLAQMKAPADPRGVILGAVARELPNDGPTFRTVSVRPWMRWQPKQPRRSTSALPSL